MQFANDPEEPTEDQIDEVLEFYENYLERAPIYPNCQDYQVAIDHVKRLILGPSPNEDPDSK